MKMITMESISQFGVFLKQEEKSRNTREKYLRDIVKLADILGHSSINTTRIYTMTTGREHRRLMERMCMLL